MLCDAIPEHTLPKLQQKLLHSWLLRRECFSSASNLHITQLLLLRTRAHVLVRLLEGLQTQLTTLAEQLSLPLALLPPASNLLLEAPPKTLQSQIQLVPSQLEPAQSSTQLRPRQGSSQLGPSQSSSLQKPIAEKPFSLQAALRAIDKDVVTSDGGLRLSSISSEVLQKQFMFAVAVHEGAANLRRLLAQMRQARLSLLQAARTGVVSSGKTFTLLPHCFHNQQCQFVDSITMKCTCLP